jgi:hypothetical protein
MSFVTPVFPHGSLYPRDCEPVDPRVRFERFQSLRPHSPSRSLPLTPERRSRVAHEKCERGLSDFLDPAIHAIGRLTAREWAQELSSAVYCRCRS